jgi:deoxycytidylate deaminase
MKLAEVYELIDQDSGEEILHGQTVRQTFPQADFFLRVDSFVDQGIDSRVRRFLDVILNTDIITPTPEERAMFFAASAGTNSACLSRQVGAAVTDAAGEILAVGWNDVPKAGGGLYSSGIDSSGDHRCANLEGGVCFNDRHKGLMTAEIVDALIKEKVVNDGDRQKTIDVIKKSKIRDLIEFSRAIHAEMYAIISGSQKSGSRMVGGKLFCTTYPCHSCARHIIAAGIKEVYYIEPYRKSLATTLHSDDITEAEAETNKVRLLPFDGVAPSRYMELFSMGEDSRKKNGKKSVVNPKEAQQKSEISLEALPVLEAAVVKILVERKLIDAHENEKAVSVKQEAARV